MKLQDLNLTQEQLINVCCLLAERERKAYYAGAKSYSRDVKDSSIKGSLEYYNHHDWDRYADSSYSEDER